MSLYALTKHLHHACEAHPFGSRMSKGNVTPQEWADWLWAFSVLHFVVDPSLPRSFARGMALEMDLSVLPPATPSRAAFLFAAHLTEEDRTGAAYVLHGAHCSGGRVMAPILSKRGLPVAHTVYQDWDAVRKWLTSTRDNEDAAHVAASTFQCLLSVMDEIEDRSRPT